MKPILLFLACTALAADPPSPPQNLRILSELPVGTTIPIAVTGETNLIASWTRPDANTWICESSTNGMTWTQAGQWAELSDRATRATGQPFIGSNFTESVVQTNWMVRIRRVR